MNLKGEAFDIYNTLNDKQKELVHQLVHVAARGIYIGKDAHIIATMEEKEPFTIRLRFSGNREDVIGILAMMMEGLANHYDKDFEEIISMARYLYYSKKESEENEDE